MKSNYISFLPIRSRRVTQCRVVKSSRRINEVSSVTPIRRGRFTEVDR